MKINQAAVAVVSTRHSSPVLTNSLTGQWYVYDALSSAQASVENLEPCSHLETADVVVVDRGTFAELERASREDVELKRRAAQYDDCVNLANEHEMISAGRPAVALRSIIDGAKRNEAYTSLLVEACVKYGYHGNTPVEMVEWLTAKLQSQATKHGPEPLTVNVQFRGDPKKASEIVGKQLRWHLYRNAAVEAVLSLGYRSDAASRIATAVEDAIEAAGFSPDPPANLGKDREAAVNRITTEIDKHRQAGNYSLALEYEQLLATYLAR